MYSFIVYEIIYLMIVSQYFQLNKQTEQMLTLLAICHFFYPIRLDETLLQVMKESVSTEKLSRLNSGLVFLNILVIYFTHFSIIFLFILGAGKPWRSCSCLAAPNFSPQFLQISTLPSNPTPTKNQLCISAGFVKL